MRLPEVEIGSSADVVTVHGEGRVPKRLMEMGLGKSEIARRLGRHRSTIEARAAPQPLR